ncbi:MAG: hypothetical protein ACREMB_17595 [Candidatus Rokuibacteriota bacterium]
MRTPIRPVPHEAVVWTRRLRRLRWLDALAAWLLAWLAALALSPGTDGVALGVVVALFLPIAAVIPPLRRAWRPASIAAAWALSGSLKPGDRAWHISPDGHARLVLVTGLRRTSVVVAGVVQDSGEGAVVSRLHGLLVRAERR